MKTKLKAIGRSLFYTLSVCVIIVVAYIAIGVVISITMLDPAYMLFENWPVLVRAAFSGSGIYILARAILDDFTSRGNGN